jgi:hypothetical protein
MIMEPQLLSYNDDGNNGFSSGDVRGVYELADVEE